MDSKHCRDCGRELVVGENWTAGRAGRRNYICNPCQAVYDRGYYLAHKEEKDGRTSHLRTRYNITPADYDVMLESQGNGCAICGRTEAEEGRHLSVDHDHETGEVRGLLCVDCNRGLGGFRDSPDLCRTAANYLNGG